MRGTADRMNTAKEYADQWKDTLPFCRIGCWQSALLCDRTNCPNSPLPIMVPASLCSYIMYMFGKLDVRVTDYQNDTPMSDIFKKPLMCVGKWKSTNNCKNVALLSRCCMICMTIYKARIIMSARTVWRRLNITKKTVHILVAVSTAMSLVFMQVEI